MLPHTVPGTWSHAGACVETRCGCGSSAAAPIPQHSLTLLVVVRWPVGGIRTFIRYVYPNFPGSTFRFIFYLPRYQEYAALTQELGSLGAEFVLAPADFNARAVIPDLFRLIRGRRVDVIHAHGLTSALHTFPVARVTHTPHLTTFHDVFREAQFRGVAGRVKRLCLDQVIRHLDAIHFIGEDARANLLQSFPRTAPRSDADILIPNGIHTAHFLAAGTRDLHRELRAPSDCFLLGFFGRFMSQKGFAVLVDAVAHLAADRTLGKPFLVLTFEEGSFFQQEVSRIARLGLSSYFRHLAFTPDISSTLKGLDLVAVPSLWEACPLLPMEAMVAGTPLIGSDCVGLREVLRNTPAAIIPTGNARALADAIRREIVTPSRAAAQAFTHIAAERFDVRERAADLEQALMTFAHRRRGSSSS